MPDLTEDYWALRKDVGAVFLPRDYIAVVGEDAETFLQGQLSQDVTNLPHGGAWSFLLQPQGKVDAFLRVELFHRWLMRSGIDSDFAAGIVKTELIVVVRVFWNLFLSKKHRRTEIDEK